MHVVGQIADHAIRRAQKRMWPKKFRRIPAFDAERGAVQRRMDFLGDLVGLIFELADHVETGPRRVVPVRSERRRRGRLARPGPRIRIGHSRRCVIPASHASDAWNLAAQFAAQIGVVTVAKKPPPFSMNWAIAAASGPGRIRIRYLDGEKQRHVVIGELPRRPVDRERLIEAKADDVCAAVGFELRFCHATARALRGGLS